MENKITGFYEINNTKINEDIFHEEMVSYRIEEREDFIDNLIDWIGEANSTDKELMKSDLKYLMSLEDDYIFSSIETNEYVAKSDNATYFNEIANEILELNEELKG